MTHYINGKWTDGVGTVFTSLNPATGEVIWKGKAAAEQDVDAAVKAARGAFFAWANRPFEERKALVETFKSVLEARKAELTEIICKDTGKVKWDAANEVAGMIGKVAISIQAYGERTGERFGKTAEANTAVRHRPHGVMAVFGPYNFPCHLPNGHIVPALLAGNCVVFKPSEQTPLVAEFTVKCWEEAGLPAGVMNLVQGERDTGIALSKHDGIDGLLFTGSSATGAVLARQFAEKPHKILALEMGGNNPLIIDGISDIKAAAYIVMQSSFMTSGQRCSCARRLILPHGKEGDALIAEVARMASTIQVGSYTDNPEPFMGPLISNAEADKLLAAQESLRASGGKILLEMKRLKKDLPFISPGMVEVTAVKNRPDQEYFGPLLQVIRVNDFNAALAEANNTRFGLTAGLLSNSREKFDQFLATVHAGVINWNRPITGASSAAPYGGLGISGNHRPSAYYAADYCAYPVASMEKDVLLLPESVAPGIEV